MNIGNMYIIQKKLYLSVLFLNFDSTFAQEGVVRVTICHVDARQTSAEMGIVTLFKGVVFCHISVFQGSEFMGELIHLFFSYERIPFTVIHGIRE